MKKNTIMRWLTMYILMAVVEKQLDDDKYNIVAVKTKDDAAEAIHKEWAESSDVNSSSEFPEDDMKDIINESEFMKKFDPVEGEKAWISGLNSAQIDNYLTNLEKGKKGYVLTDNNITFSYVEY